MNKVILRKGGFTDDSDPIHDMGIGINFCVDNILYENDNCLLSCYGSISVINDTVCLIEIVKGNLVIKSLKVKEMQKCFGVTEVKIELKNKTQFTILEELNILDLYTRIKVFYENVLNNCLGVSFNEQEEFLFGIEKQNLRNQKHHYLKQGAIENSIDCIKNLSNNPSSNQMKNLCEEILLPHGVLEYGCIAKDKNSVEMNWYAKELLKRLQ